MSEISMRQQFADTMLQVGRQDPNLVVLVGDISHFSLQPFAKACPGRYYNVGICEAAMVGMAAGLAKLGFYPVVHTIAPFIIERAFEQIKLDFCYQKLGGSLITVGSVFDYSNLGCTHHCYDDFALLKSLPGTQIFYPASLVEFDRLYRQTYQNNLLKLFRLPGTQHGVEFKPEAIQPGRAIKINEGCNLTIAVTGPQLKNALQAKDELTAMGLEPEIIYVHTIRPLDTGLICASAAKTKRVLVVEEHMQSGGLGDDVLKAVKDIAGVRFGSLAIPDQFVTGYGSYEHHCQTLGLTVAGIVKKAGEFL
jgi:transketolase